MDERKVMNGRTRIEKNKIDKRIKIFGHEKSAFFVQLTHKFQDCIKTQIKRLSKAGHRKKSTSSFIEGKKESSLSWEADLEKQMQAWRENPSWEDNSPEIKVSIPKGTLGNLSVKVNFGLPPDAVYNIVIDPDNKRVFKNIEEVISRKVLLDEGQRQVVELEQAALWRFLWWSGRISVHVLVDQNRADYSMNFKQVKAGFMKRFEGSWRVEPLFVDESACAPFKPENLTDYQVCTRGKGRVGSIVSLEQLIQPAIVPPPPISWYLRGITARTAEMLINDLRTEAARLRNAPTLDDDDDDEKSNEVVEIHQHLYEKRSLDDMRDIKERWRVRRRNVRQSYRRPSAAKR